MTYHSHSMENAPSTDPGGLTLDNLSGVDSLNGQPHSSSINYHPDPFGNTSLVWECWPGSGSSAGGWNSLNFDVDNAFTYMYTIYIKKVGDRTNGSTYWGTRGLNSGGSTGGGVEYIQSSNETSYSLSTNPYFFSGDLPQADKWYLLVGYVHHTGSTPSSVTASGHMSALYDCETGERNPSGGDRMRDYRWRTIDNQDISASNHRSYQYYPTKLWAGQVLNQLMWSPGVFKISGSAGTNYPRVEDLLDRGKMIAHGNYPSGGAFISQDTIYAPTIAGTTGKFSGSVVVGHDSSGITIDGLNKKIHQGTGTYGNSNTGFYLDGEGSMSLKDKFTFDGTNLSISGSGSFGGNISAPSGDIGGWTISSNELNAGGATGTRLYSSGIISVGALDSATDWGDAETGVYIDASGNALFKQGSANSNYIQFYDGDVVIKTDPLSLDSSGNLTISGTVSASEGNIAGWTINSGSIQKGGVHIGTIADFHGLHMGQNYFYSSSNNMGTYFRVGGTNDFIKFIGNSDFTTSEFEISSSNIHISGGNAVFSGSITATDGEIGGWTIDDTQIKKLDSDGGVVIDGGTTPNINVRTGSHASTTRTMMGEVSTGRFGIFGFDTGGVNKIFELSNLEQQIAGFHFSTSEITSSTGTLKLKSNGQITGSKVLFSGGEIAGFEITDTQINDTGDNLLLKSSGQITGSTVKFDGGKIAGWNVTSSLDRSRDGNDIPMIQTGSKFEGMEISPNEIVGKGYIGRTSHSLQTFAGSFNFAPGFISAEPNSDGWIYDQPDGDGDSTQGSGGSGGGTGPGGSGGGGGTP